MTLHQRSAWTIFAGYVEAARPAQRGLGYKGYCAPVVADLEGTVGAGGAGGGRPGGGGGGPQVKVVGLTCGTVEAGLRVNCTSQQRDARSKPVGQLQVHCKLQYKVRVPSVEASVKKS